MKTRQELFTKHYKENLFKGKISRSGPGSDPDQTSHLITSLIDLFKKLNITKIFDAPCGDCLWIKHIWDKIDLDMYIGMDIVEELIEENKTKYLSNNRMFLWGDLVSITNFPNVDLVLCRDCLVHLSFNSSKQILTNLANSNIPYFLLTTFTIKERANHDWEDGTNWYPMNLMNHPFNLPYPKILINEHCTEYHNQYTDKSLGLWSREELLAYVASQENT